MNVSVKVIIAQLVVQRMVLTAVVGWLLYYSCLYHSLNYKLSYDELYRDVHGGNSGFTLRKELNEDIRDNRTYQILDHPCLWHHHEILVGKVPSASQVWKDTRLWCSKLAATPLSPDAQYLFDRTPECALLSQGPYNGRWQKTRQAHMLLESHKWCVPTTGMHYAVERCSANWKIILLSYLLYLTFSADSHF